jgi:hypothetical protein
MEGRNTGPVGGETLEGEGSVCLEEEAGRLREQGLSAAEISARMGVDAAWVEELLSRLPDAEGGDRPTARP